MAEPSLRKRIWGWYFFDWASQPYHTVLVTFVFGPLFATIATAHFVGTGLAEDLADARAQSLWSLCLTISGLIIGFGGPILGALADTSGRRMPWIVLFSAMTITGAAGLWWTDPDGANLWWPLVSFGIGFIGVEYALIFINAQLPSLGTQDEIGRLSGSAFAFGYLGGLVALAILLIFFVEMGDGSTTLLGNAPALGLDGAEKEGARFSGPFVAAWYAVFMIPYFLWVREVHRPRQRHSMSAALKHLMGSIRSLRHRISLTAFLGSSMVYRDAMNGLYGFGGLYAALVLDWDLTAIGVFGIVAALAAALFTWIGGRLDARFGPKPVIVAAILVLTFVCLTIVLMDRTMIYGIPLAEGSRLPDITFFGCGLLIGGFGGILQAASRTLMARHADPEQATEAFGLYGLSGRATAFLAPMLIGIVTTMTGSARLGVAPVIALFLLGLVLLRWVKPDGDRAVPWSEEPVPHS